MARRQSQPRRRLLALPPLRNPQSYLFDPEEIAHLLGATCPLLAAEIDPRKEGTPSSAFPSARRSERQIYRLLANQHYGNLRDLLGAIERCWEAGFRHPHLLRTRQRGYNLAGMTAEICVAEHFRRMGYDIGDFDTSKSGTSVPDILVSGSGLTAAVEVYCPSALENVKAFEGALVDLVKQLDVPYDYSSELSIRPESNRMLTTAGDVDHALTAEVRADVIASIDEQLRDGLAREGTRSVLAEERSCHLLTRVVLDGAQKSTGRLPARAGVSSFLDRGGYNAEALFGRILDRVSRKLKAGQAVGLPDDPTPLFVVDLSQSEVTTELPPLGGDYYREAFEQLLTERLTDLRGYAAVVLSEPKPSRLGFHWIVEDDAHPDRREWSRLFC